MPSFLDHCPYQWFTINLLRPAKCERGGIVGAGTPLAMVWPLPPTWRSLSIHHRASGLGRLLPPSVIGCLEPTLSGLPGARCEWLKSILHRTLRGGLTHNSLNA